MFYLFFTKKVKFSPKNLKDRIITDNTYITENYYFNILCYFN